MLSDWRVGRRSQNLAGRSFWEQSEQNFLNSLGNTDEKVFTICGFEGTTIVTEIQEKSWIFFCLKMNSIFYVSLFLCVYILCMEEKNMRKRYGYIRVSAKELNPERQYVALQEQGIGKKDIFLDKISGKDFERPAYKKLLKKLQKNDVVVVKSIDRLGRNYGEILEQWRKLTKEIGADIQVIDMPLLNTDMFHEDLTGVFISDLVLQILAYVAETERTFIKQRQAEGIAIAKAKGVHFGNRKRDLPEEFDKYRELWMERKITCRKAADELGMSYSTFYRRCQDKKEEI